MIRSSKRSILSLIHTEPFSSDEYNQNLVEQLTLYHKQNLLQLVRTQPNILNESPSKLGSLPVNKLNKQNLKFNRTEWLNILKAWINIVSHTSEEQNLMVEDAELLKYIRRNQCKERTQRKQKSSQIKDLSTHCRICLASNSSKMLFLFNDNQQSNEEVTLLDKLNYCSCFTSKASENDQLPRYICMSCSILVENAYQLRILCMKTEEKLHELHQKDEQDVAVDHSNNIEIELSENLDEGEQAKIMHFPHLIESESRREKDTLETGCENEDTQSKSIRKYRCDICSAVFANKLSICDHMNQNHKSDVNHVVKPYQCTECDKWFRVKCSLTIHLRTHTGQRPYSCEVCGKSFKTSSALSNHRVIHTEAKDFKCSTCSFSTNTKANLRIHGRIHSGVQPYACQICSMRFRTASNVVKHMRNIHEKQKSNKCDKCGRSFFTRESLRKHSITHTSIKPFRCPQQDCSLSYGWYNGLKKHIRHQHPDEHVKLPSEKFFFDKLKGILPY